MNNQNYYLKDEDKVTLTGKQLREWKKFIERDNKRAVVLICIGIVLTWLQGISIGRLLIR